MECGFLDAGCQVSAFLAPFIFWAKVVFACVAAVLAAAVLLWAYRKAGWWGVGIVLSFGVAAVMFKTGVDVGQKWHEKEVKERPEPEKPHGVFPKLDGFLKDIMNGNRRR